MTRPLRLTSTQDFKRVFAAGRRGSSGLVTAVAADRDGVEESRVGIAVGGALGNAVRRNRVKRLLREAARAVAIKPGTDIVLIARPDAAGRTLSEVTEAVASALRQADASC
jgi:ribonuclease P protein component